MVCVIPSYIVEFWTADNDGELLRVCTGLAEDHPASAAIEDGTDRGYTCVSR